MANAFYVIKNRESLVMTLEQILIKKANPFHAADGRFTSASGRGGSKAVYVSTGDKFKTALDNAKELKKNRDRDSRDLKNERWRYSKQKNNKKDIAYYRERLKNNWQENLDENYLTEGKFIKFPLTNKYGKIIDVQRFKNGGLKYIKVQNDQEKAREENYYNLSDVSGKFDISNKYTVNDLNKSVVEVSDKENNGDIRFYGDKSKFSTKIIDLLDSEADKDIESYKQLRKQRLESKRSKAQKSELPLKELAAIYRVKKANPYKDETGKWTSKDKAKSIAEWFKESGAKQRLAAGAIGGIAGGTAGALGGAAIGNLIAAPTLGTGGALAGALAGAATGGRLGLLLGAKGAAAGSLIGGGIGGLGGFLGGQSVGTSIGAKAGALIGGISGVTAGFATGKSLQEGTFEEKLQELKDKASAQTDKLKDAVKARVGDLKNKASKEFDAAKQKTHAAIESKAAQAKELIKQKANEVKNKAKAAATSKLKELTARYKPIKKYDLTALRNA